MILVELGAFMVNYELIRYMVSDIIYNASCFNDIGWAWYLHIKLQAHPIYGFKIWVQFNLFFLQARIFIFIYDWRANLTISVSMVNLKELNLGFELHSIIDK